MAKDLEKHKGMALLIRFNDANLKRFRSKYTVCEFSGCWLWKGAKDRKGYGHFWYMKRARWAHRVSYAAFVGCIPDKQTVHHKCFNPSCVNPDHLELMTHERNSMLAWADEIEG